MEKFIRLNEDLSNGKSKPCFININHISSIVTGYFNDADKFAVVWTSNGNYVRVLHSTEEIITSIGSIANQN